LKFQFNFTLLASLLSGLAGAILGFFGSLYAQRRSAKATQKGAGRALLAEIIGNYESLRASERPPEGYSRGVWDAQLPLIAQLLAWNELRLIATPYALAAEPLSRVPRLLAYIHEQRFIEGSALLNSLKEDINLNPAWKIPLGHARGILASG
jgi:hypothetical protein